MMLGLLASMLATSEVLLNRYILTKQQVGVHRSIALCFLMGVLLMLPAIPLFFKMPDWTPALTTVFIGMCIIAVIFNIFYQMGIKYNTIEKSTPLYLSTNVFTITLAYALFPEERNTFVLVLALISSIAILSVNLNRSSITFDRYAIFMLLAALLFSVHNIFIASLLAYFNPFTLYFLRCCIGAVLMLAFYRPTLQDLHPKNPIWLLMTIIVIEQILVYWSYSTFGVIGTTLLMTLAPIATIYASHFLLKEELHATKVVATIVIVGCVVLSLIL